MTHANDPAFPKSDFVDANGNLHWGGCGLSKRELFAAMAMQGLLAANCTGDNGYTLTLDAEAASKWSVAHADALLNALANPGTVHGEGAARE